MTEQVNNQSNDSIVSRNPENKLIIQTKIESDEDALKYDRLVVNKVKDLLIKKTDRPSTSLFIVDDLQPAFDSLEISQASSVADVIDKMHSDNYNQESLDLKMNSFARAIYEVAQKDEKFQEAVIAGPFSVDNHLLSGSSITKGIGEKVVSFVTTNSELRYPMDFVDDCFNGLGSGVKYSYESLDNIVNKASNYVRFAKTSSFKDERARLDMLRFLDKKLHSLKDSSHEEIEEKGYQKERLKFLEKTVNQSYKDAVNLTDDILTPKNFSEEEKSSENKSIIPYTKKDGVYRDGYDKSADKINYTEFNTSALNQEGINISISLNIMENGSIEVIQSKAKSNSDFSERISANKFPLADTRGATQHFIDTYKGYLK